MRRRRFGLREYELYDARINKEILKEMAKEMKRRGEIESYRIIKSTDADGSPIYELWIF